MRTEKKKIIIDEITHWKENKLLPETYCNFLLALYTGGDTDRPAGKKNIPLTMWLVLAILISSLYIYFTEMKPLLQMALLGAAALFLAPVIIKSRKNGMFQLPAGSLFLILLLLTLTGIDACKVPGTAAYPAAIAIHSAVWIAFSLRFKIRSMLAAGVAGLILAAASFLF
ncbi:hypothetical protein GKZ89_03470 [Bacillus mangrovi]|uniref:Uncharacterized protein n=1 Tax=Metabacillus mangrovi TaxID=1491830 RepID=A0A7X2V3U8_9BACI|nr:hypothetical protein [Metabacillus mangrovi]MTH52454.1 hypothetical protein [Metabacillus mangrovi]